MQHILDVQFPDENPQGAPGGDYQQINSSPNMFGASSARALSSFGEGLEKAGNTAIDAATEQAQLQTKVHLADAKSWYADQATDLHSKIMSLSGRAAIDALPDFKQKLVDLRQQALNQTPSPMGKAMLNESLTTIQDQYYRYWSGHAAGQFKTYQSKVAQDAIASSSALAVNSLLAGDELSFERRLREQDAEVHNFYDGEGYAAGDMDAEVAKRRGITLKTAIETVGAGGDVAKAQALFDKYRDRMDPQSVLQVTANLKSGVAQLQGRDIADEASGHSTPSAESVAGTPSSFVAQVKRSEGFAPSAKWDVKQFSNGYGTRAQFEGEQISREEADKRFNAAWTNATRVVDNLNHGLDPGTRAALSSLTFQTGESWTHSGLGDAIRVGDLERAKSLFVQYNKVDGQTNEGVANRRFRESQWIGTVDAPTTNGPLADKQQAYERVLARTDTNPLVQTAAMARLNQVYGIYHAEQVNQNAAFDTRLQDTQAEAMATGAAKAPLTEPDFVNRYGATQGLQEYGEYQKNLALGSDIAGLATMSPDEQAQVLAKHTPQPGSAGFAEEQKRQQAVAKAIAHVAKERDDDPAAFAARRLPAAQAAFADLSTAVNGSHAAPDQRKAAAAHYAEVTLAEQARVGVPAQARQVLPSGYAEPIKDQIAAAATSDDPKTRQAAMPLINAQKELWGRYWPNIVPQIAPPGAAPLVKAIAAGAEPVAMQRLLDIPKGENPAAILKEQNEVTAKNLNTAINVSFAPFLGSMVGAQKDRDFGGYADLGRKLGALYVRDGMQPSEAAAKAFNDLVGNRYDFRDTWRVPKDPQINPDDVQRGTVEARDELLRARNGNPASPFGNVQLQINDLGVSDNEADSRHNYYRDGVFVTSPRNDGLNIAYKNTFLTDTRTGRPILLTWDQLQNMGGSREAKAAEVSRATLGSEASP